MSCALIGCAAPRERFDTYLREVKPGTPITTVSEALGGISFYECEAGSSLYAFWTLRGTIGSMGINLGAVGKPGLNAGLHGLDQLKYTGHFLINDGHGVSVRWVYTDGLVQDER